MFSNGAPQGALLFSDGSREYGPAQWMTRTLAADGVERVHVRLLNHPKLADEQLYPARGLSWAA